MIDIGEKWAAILGVTPVIDKKMPHIYIADRKRVENLETEILDMAEKLCNGTLGKLPWPNVPEYKGISGKLKEPINEDQLANMIGAIPDGNGDAYRREAVEQYAFLINACPRSSRNTLAGPIPVRPDSVEVFRFNGLYRVANDPLYVIQLMSRGALLKEQTDACRNLYPSISSFIDDAIGEAITNCKAKNLTGYEVPYRADFGIRDWRGIPLVIKPYQYTYTIQDALKQNTPSAPSKAVLSPESKASLSAAQSALYDTIKQ